MVVPPDSAQDQPGSGKREFTTGQLILPITLFVLAGVPLVAYLWETGNRLFAGRFEPLRLLLALVALAVLLFVLRLLARALNRWEGTRTN